ncbi:MAG: TrkA family potassium uptake protein [Ruminococcaceae bacterium]|nr:TrkA family potassium uptake protein [Oscillospiraceae bacterium]
MSINKSYAVFGLGRYGYAVAKELADSGAEVLAVDTDEVIVNSAIADIPFCKCADITDAKVIEQLGVSNIDVVIVAMASNLEASVMAVMLCKEAGVKTVIAKCANEMHYKILSKVGADKVVFPESESGTRLAKNLLSSGFVDMMELSDDVSIIELDIKPEWAGKTLIELDLRKKYSINVVAIRHNGNVEVTVDPTKPLENDMKLVVIVNTSKLGKLLK